MKPQEDPPMLVKDQQAWTPLRNLIQAMARMHGRPLKYIPNRGNAGDALIAAGSWQFFEDIDVYPAYGTTPQIRGGDAVVYAGGGNLVPQYTNCRDFLRRCLAVDVSSALVMPHTIRGHVELLSQLDARFTLVCRDVASMAHVCATGSRARILFAPDMALYLNVNRLFERCASMPAARIWLGLARTGRLLPYLRWRYALSRLVAPKDGAIDVIRMDVEATASQRGDKRWDVPNLYGSKYLFREEAEWVSRDLLRFFGRMHSVRTNRLHAGVAGALMDCNVTYLENSYGKIGAVYDAWLSHLPFVRFETGRT